MSTIAKQIGCYGIIVDAKDQAAADFYVHYGFVALGEAFPRRLFIPIKTVLAASK